MPASVDPWTMKPFNTLFDVVLAALICGLALASIALRKSSERTRRAVLVSACLATIVGFFIYKYALSLDREYNVIRAPMGGFSWWGELPLHLCNVNMLLVPIAVLKRSKSLMSFCFFVGPLGAMMALAMPGAGFTDCSLLLPRMLGYYGTHFMVVVECLAIVTFGFYRPDVHDLPKTVLTIVLITLGIHALNMLLRLSGIYPDANYFYTVDTEGSFLLDLFHSWIPLPFLYLLPGLAILAVYMLVAMSFFALLDHRAKTGRQDAGGRHMAKA